jgi:secreted PhoX family phosphatase
MHRHIPLQKRALLALSAAVVLGPGLALADDGPDFGARVEHLLEAQSERLFGFGKPTTAADVGDNGLTRDQETAQQRQDLAKGLKAEYVTRKVAVSGDMIAFWPNDLKYTHLIVCIEQGRATGGRNAGVQRVNVTPGRDYGKVETIVYGMANCDGIRTTQWGTVVATEETDDGGAYEILDPLGTTGYWIADRGAPGADADIRVAVNDPNANSGEDRIRKRTALVTQAWEGLEFLDNGVVIAGDEERPGATGPDQDGGAIFRFVPAIPYVCANAPVRPGQLCSNTVRSLGESPLAAGTNYALVTQCTGDGNIGQGCEYGRTSAWVKISNPANARSEANANGATGYCRPEDLHIDRESPLYRGGEGILWCWTNTCAGTDGEALCVTETNAQLAARDEVEVNNGLGRFPYLANATAIARPNVTRFVQNDARMRAHDNLDFQPVTRNVYIIEDASFGEVWACLPDGADRDLVSDGCVSMLTVNDPLAEPTGFIFDGTGETAFYIVQHGEQPASLLDFASNPVNGRTDDLIKIMGFKVKRRD